MTDKVKIFYKDNEGTVGNKSLKTPIVKNKLIAVIVILIVLVSIISFQLLQVQEENNLFKATIRADRAWSENSIAKQRAESYYNIASLAYEEADYDYVEANCILARDYYMDAIGGFEKIKAELIDKNIDHILIDTYVRIIDEQLTMNYNMFEACEHFEAAARAYDNNFYDTGDSDIEMMNEKIVSHDDAVVRYNDLMSKYRVELEKLA